MNIDKLIEQAINSANIWPSFIPTRYPYTYAADFLRSHPEIVPDSIGGPSWRTTPSRGESSEVRQRWAKSLDMDDDELARKFADAYLKEHRIEAALTGESEGK